MFKTTPGSDQNAFVDMMRKSIEFLSHGTVALAIIIGAGVLYIVSNARIGLIDPHSWRQADVYAHTLGFMRSPDISLFTTFDGKRILFDMPIYQLTTAFFARGARIDPLIVSRFINAAIFVPFVLILSRIGDRFHKGAGILAAGLVTVSPLMLHFWSVPLPDVLTLTIAMAGFYMAMEAQYEWSALLFGSAAFIKSPIAFIALVGLASLLLLMKPTKKRLVGFFWIGLLSLIGAVLAEAIRRTVTPPTPMTAAAYSTSWYFGSIDVRKDPAVYRTMWVRLTQTFPGTVPCICLLALAAVGLCLRRREIWAPIIACISAYVVGWLVFPILLLNHEYYALTGATFAILGIATGLSVFVRRTRQLNVALALLIPLCMVYTPRMSQYELTKFYDAARYAVRGQPNLAVVESSESGPVWGGLTGKPVTHYAIDDFEGRCEETLASYRAFVTVGLGPSCLDTHLDELQTRIQGPNETTVWVFSNG